jgi:ABC-2 family transporter protein
VTTVALAPPRRAWLVVAGQELRDLWLGGRGLALTLAYSLLLSVMTYLTATNSVLNFLEQREAVNLTLQVAVAVGALLVLLGAADALSGERERGTLESLLLAPVHRLDLVVGKGIAARSRSGSSPSSSRSRTSGFSDAASGSSGWPSAPASSSARSWRSSSPGSACS